MLNSKEGGIRLSLSLSSTVIAKHNICIVYTPTLFNFVSKFIVSRQSAVEQYTKAKMLVLSLSLIHIYHSKEDNVCIAHASLYPLTIESTSMTITLIASGSFVSNKSMKTLFKISVF